MGSIWPFSSTQDFASEFARAYKKILILFAFVTVFVSLRFYLYLYSVYLYLCTQVRALQQRCVQVCSQQLAYKMIFRFVFVFVFAPIILFICCCMLLYLCTEDRALQYVQVGPHQLAPFKQTCHSPPRQTCPNQNIIRILEQQQLVRISNECHHILRECIT